MDVLCVEFDFVMCYWIWDTFYTFSAMSSQELVGLIRGIIFFYLSLKLDVK